MWSLDKLWCFDDFLENGSRMEKFDFDELERIDDVVVLSYDEYNLSFEL